MEKWEPLDFVWPRLHCNQNREVQLQLKDDSDLSELGSDKEWENAVSLYDEYLKSVQWPEGIKDLQHNGCLHDALLLDRWHYTDKLSLTLKQYDGAWDGRKYIAVILYSGVRSLVPLPEPEIIKGHPKLEKKFWAYDQWADLGDGWYRHYLYFSDECFYVDFREVASIRIMLSGNATASA
jgi:hypothetical protein